MDHVSIIDEIITGGYSSPILVDEAERRHAHNMKIGQKLLEKIASVDNKLPVEWDQIGTVRQGHFPEATVDWLVKDLDVSTKFLEIECMIGRFPCEIRYIPKRENYTASVSLTCAVKDLNQLEQLPAEYRNDVLEGKKVTMKFSHLDLRFDGMIRKHYSAPSMREVLLEDVKSALTSVFGKNSPISLTLKGDGSREEKAELTSLFFADVKKSNYNSYSSMDKCLVATDFGLKNVDDLAVVIYLAFEMVWSANSAGMTTNAMLTDFNNYVNQRVMDACNAGCFGQYYAQAPLSDRPELWQLFCAKKHNLLKFIEFLGGKVPHKVCWRVEK